MANYGPLKELLADDSITEIMVNGPSKVFVECGGKLQPCPVKFNDEAELLAVIAEILNPLGREVSAAFPCADGRLADGSRVNVVIPPAAVGGSMLTIRKFSGEFLDGGALVSKGSASPQMLEFLKLCVQARKNIVVSGGTGSGKTTLLNMLSSYIPQTERILTIEDTSELKLRQENWGRLEARAAAGNGEGAVTIRQLLINALRMRPDRIVVGECRGGEALDMLQAMNTGHDGSLTTVHANTPRDALKRLEVMVLMAGFELPLRAIREQIASAVNIIVQAARLTDGSRKITAISEISGMEGDVITLSPIFELDKSGKFRATQTIPAFLQAARARGFETDMKIFQ
jgi:pilus assembly protein CpaF